MTRRSRKKTGRKNRRMGRRTFLLGAGAAVCAAAGLALRRGTFPAAADSTPEPPADPNPALPAGEWRAVWVSYLEWAAMDFSTEDAFRAGVVQLLDNCTGLGLNTVLAQVRPFGDALYRSSLFPWSHLCTSVQGKDPGFDPLDVLLQEAHTRGISVEAWVNPYRLRSSAAMPPNLADSNLANTHPEWVCTVDEGLYLNPAEPAAADYVVQGVAELVQNYAVDGIHFDDYFYPTTDESIDAAQFAASGAGNLAARRTWPCISGWEPTVWEWATAAATKTACRAGAPAVRWPTRWPFCGSREPGAGPCTGTVRCSGRSRLPSPLPSVGHWRPPTAKKLHEIGRQRAQKPGGSLVRCCKMRYTIQMDPALPEPEKTGTSNPFDRLRKRL